MLKYSVLYNLSNRCKHAYFQQDFPIILWSKYQKYDTGKKTKLQKKTVGQHLSCLDRNG